MHAAGQHWAPIFNPGISTSKGYRAYEEGTSEGIWIKDVNGKPYIGQVRLHSAVWPPGSATDQPAGMIPSCYVGVQHGPYVTMQCHAAITLPQAVMMTAGEAGRPSLQRSAAPT